MIGIILAAVNATLLLWLLLVPIVIIFTLMIVSLVIRIIKMTKLHRLSKGVKIATSEQEEFYAAYGGRDNILKISHELSRITVEVIDLELVNTDTLKELGASGVLFTGNVVKASFGEEALNIYNIIKLK